MNTGMRGAFYWLNLLAVVLTLVVITVGAYVRLSHAGLGCPDWPGCYGQLVVPELGAETAAANAAFPANPVDPAKAWKEMAHRYLASTLGFVILVLAALAWLRRSAPGQQLALPLVLVALVLFQGLLGMWTVTLLLKPLVVAAHLLGGMATLALLWWCWLRQGQHLAGFSASGLLARWAGFALLVLAVQLFLGVWTSSNYAALACTDFPSCQGQWWPRADFEAGFTLWRGLGINYEHGVLDSAGRTAIHLAHRIGALVTAAVMAVLAALLWRQRQRAARFLALALVAALALQVSLGIVTVVTSLPLPVAVAHNGGAALLLLVVMTINHAAWQRPRRPQALPAEAPA